MDIQQTGHQTALINALNRIQAIIEFDLNGIILHANELFLSAMGYSLDELLGQHHRIFVILSMQARLNILSSGLN